MGEGVFVHPTAIVESGQIGEGTRIWAFAHIMAGVSIGKHCNIGDHCFIESGVIVGSNVTLKNGNMLWDGVVLEDGVFLGPQAVFTNDLYPRSPRLAQAAQKYASRDWLLPTLVQRGASVGAGAVIVAGSTLGAFCMVGAGAVVTKDVPSHALVVGNPARQLGWVCQCGQRLDFGGSLATCPSCSLDYAEREGLVRLQGSR